MSIQSMMLAVDRRKMVLASVIAISRWTRKRHLYCLLIGLTVAIAPVFVNAQSRDSEPRLILHLLEYLSKDYGGAVSNGAISNAAEYNEQVEFARSALSLARDSSVTNKTDIVRDIEQLNSLIEAKADAQQVSTLAAHIEQRVIELAHISQAPIRWPNLTHGRELYRANCISCHGESGAGDGPASTALDPRPANFLVPEFADQITPFRAFNSIRLGVPKTAMSAWPTLSDEDVWDIAFYVTAFHMQANTIASTVPVLEDELTMAASKSDAQLMVELPGDDQTKREKIIALRLHSVGHNQNTTPLVAADNILTIARTHLTKALSAYEQHDYAKAKEAALLAYLEGIEPIEPQLRANDSGFTTRLEGTMAAVRAAIEDQRPEAEVRHAIKMADANIDTASQRLSEHSANASVTFILTLGILLREGFEAVLILIALLAVIRATGANKAARWVHAGWIGAVGTGVLSWFFSGWLIAISGAQRELLEGITGLLAVATLLYIGFWLHSRTEINRWKQFIDGQVRTALQGSSLWGLTGIAFVAVFREAFETVLFLRAVALAGGTDGSLAMLSGVIVGFVFLLLLSWWLLRSSVKLPIRTIFSLSAALMALLAVMLIGKAFRAFQEVGMVSVTAAPWTWTSDLLGIYPTWQTLIPQIVIIGILYCLWLLGKEEAKPK